MTKYNTLCYSVLISNVNSVLNRFLNIMHNANKIIKHAGVWVRTDALKFPRLTVI